MNKSAFDKISFFPAIESFIVFSILGFCVVAGGGVFLDFKLSLPEWYLTLIQEPLSITYFYILCIGGLLATALITWGGTKNHNGKWWFDMILLAPSRAGISCGAIVSGMLMGLAAGLLVVSNISSSQYLQYTAYKFFFLSIYSLGILFPVMVLMLYLINHNTKYNLAINALGGLYIGFLIYAGINYKEHIEWIATGSCFAILIIYAFIGKQWLMKKTVTVSSDLN